jgi:hypothetical protein
LVSPTKIYTENLPVTSQHLYHLIKYFVVHFICEGKTHIKAKRIIYHFIFI